MDGFGGFDELMFCIVMCQVRKRYASAEIHLVDVEVLSFDLLESCSALAYRRISEPYERTTPKFHLDCVFLSLTNLVDVCVSFGDLLWASQMPNK
jgi:hypothetical protein